MAEEEPLVPTAYLQNKYGILDPSTVHGWTKAGMPYVALPGRKLFKMSEVETWLRNRAAQQGKGTPS